MKINIVAGPWAPVAAWLALGALVTACLSGCSEEPQQAAPQAATPTPVVRPSAPSLDEELAQDVELPVVFPKDVPLYPGALTNTSAAGPGSVRISLSTADSHDDVLDWYAKSLPPLGWGDPTRSEFGQHQLLSAEKDGRSLRLMVSELKGKTVVFLSVRL